VDAAAIAQQSKPPPSISSLGSTERCSLLGRKRITVQITQQGQRSLWRTALELLSNAQSRQVELDLITYSATIGACEKGQQWITATSLLREMQQRHMKSDAITYSASMSACQKCEKWRSVWAIFKQMQRGDCFSTGLTYMFAADAMLVDAYVQ